MNTRLKLPLCGIILAVFIFSPPVCSGSGQLYTAAYTASGGSETAQVLIDGGPAYFLYRPEHAPSGPLGSYRRYTGLEDTQPLSVREEQVLALLGSGYPFNIGGAKQQYGLTDAEAYSPEAAGEQVMLQGVVDCFWQEPDGIVILDFKTDYIDGDLQQKAERYAPQLHAYAAALSRIFQTPVKKTILYFFSANQPIEI